MAHPEAARSYKVLVVEDEGLIAHDIARRLEAMGHQVAGPVSTAEEAIAEAPGADIVLMDIRIDGQRDGIQAATEIRERYHLPVVFLTAHADRATLDRAKQAGPFGYIVKPLGPASLQTGIEMAVAKHRVERLLEEREAWLRAAITSAGDAIVVTDAEGRVRLLNRSAEKLTGWTQAEAETQWVQKVAHLIDADSGEPGADPVPLAILRDAPVEFDRRCRMISRDGREMEIEGCAAPVRISEELLGAVMTFRDASARRWEERQIRQAQRLEAAGRLAASAAVDYTSLLAIIRSRAEHLLREFAEYRPARPALEEIRQAADAADQITRRLAAFGTRRESHAELLSINGLLRRMSRLIEAAAGPHIRVAIRASPGAGKIKADSAQMESAIMSVAAHAFAAMPEGGQALIETARVDLPHAGRTAAYVLLAVTYSAAEPDIERLFDPTATSDAGLGLALVHAAIAESGGDVSARSGPMGGSRIEILIPRLSDQALLTAAPGQAPTVMLVDERDPVRLELHNFFESSGWNLLEAMDADEAEALIEIHEGALHLLIADSALAEKLQAAHPSLPILRIVDWQEEGRLEIRRPFTEQALRNKVAALLAPPAKTVSA